MLNKKKCLIIIPGIPYPPIDGHKLKIYNVIKILNQEFDLHIVTIDRKKLNTSEEIFIRTFSYKNTHFKLSIFKSIFKIFANIFSVKPFQVCYFTGAKVKKYLERHSKEDEYVFLNLIRTAEYLEVLQQKKIIFDMVDLLSKSYFNSAKTTTSSFYKLIYNVESKRLHQYEQEIVAKSNLTLCVNKLETEELVKYGNVKWIPNGVNDKLFDYNKTELQYKNSIAFFGAMFYQPNIDAVMWLDKYVLDVIDSGINFYIIGSRPSEEIISIAKKRKNVFVTGFLEDPYIIINSCCAILAPMQNGGGIQNKILETMALGKINILTTFASTPIIGGINGKHFLVEDDSKKMAKLINDVCFNQEMHKDIGKQAKGLINSTYTWAKYSTNLYKEIEDIK